MDASLTGNAEIANVPSVSLFYPAARFTADGRHLLTTGSAGTVSVWDASTFNGVRTLGAGSARPPSAEIAGFAPIGSDDEDFTGLEVSPNGRLVAGVHVDGTVRVLDTASGRDAFTLPDGFTPAGRVAWSPTGDVLAVAGRQGDNELVEIVDTSGREVTIIQEPAGSAIGSVAFTTDGGLVTTRPPIGSAAGPVVIRNWQDGTVTQTIDTPAVSAVPSPAGDLIATVGDGREADIWSLATGQRLARLSGHTGRVIELAFSTDGSRVATASADGTVRLWDPVTGQQLLVLRGHIGVATSVSFSPDGSKLASTSADGSVRISAIELDDLITIAKGELTRSLTDEECQHYLHIDRCSDSAASTHPVGQRPVTWPPRHTSPSVGAWTKWSARGGSRRPDRALP